MVSGKLFHKIFLLLIPFFMLTSSKAFILNVSILERKINALQKQRVILCGDHHYTGSWLQNIKQAVLIGQAVQPIKDYIVLVENLISPNQFFNSSRDCAILQLKECAVLNTMIRPSFARRPFATTPLHCFGCSKTFYEKISTIFNLSTEEKNALSSIKSQNVDLRHRCVYYGESLIGWGYEPYNMYQFKSLQEDAAKTITLSYILEPLQQFDWYTQDPMHKAHSLFKEMKERSQYLTTIFEKEMAKKFKISSSIIKQQPIFYLTANASERNRLYQYLCNSVLPFILQESIEGGALWEITKADAPSLVIVCAGKNHTGHCPYMGHIKAPGLIAYLKKIGFQLIEEAFLPLHATQKDYDNFTLVPGKLIKKYSLI